MLSKKIRVCFKFLTWEGGDLCEWQHQVEFLAVRSVDLHAGYVLPDRIPDSTTVTASLYHHAADDGGSMLVVYMNCETIVKIQTAFALLHQVTVKSEIFARYNFRANAISGNSRGLKFAHFPFWVTIKKIKTNVFIIFL